MAIRVQVESPFLFLEGSAMLKHIPFYASLLGRPLAGDRQSATSHVLIYGAIEAHSMGSRGCIASNKTIALETGLSEGRAANCLSEISQAGWIEVKLDKDNHRTGIVPLLTIATPLPATATPLHASVNPPSRHSEPPLHASVNIEDSKEKTVIDNIPAQKSQGPSPLFELVNHTAEIQGLKPFPSKERQFQAAKQILSAGYTLEEAKQAADRMYADPYWHDKSFDLPSLARNMHRYGSKTKTSYYPPRVNPDLEELYPQVSD